MLFLTTVLVMKENFVSKANSNYYGGRKEGAITRTKKYFPTNTSYK